MKKQTTTVQLKEIKPLFEAGLHLGHKKNRLHPMAKRFVYKIESGISIIDLAFTVTQLNAAKAFLTASAKEGKKLLVVATKKVAVPMASELCKKYDIPCVTTKWLPGLLTNFETIMKNVNRLKELKEEKAKGEWDKLLKHERVKLNKQVIRLEKFYGGIINLEKKPDVLFIMDIRKERNAVIEAKKTGIVVVAVTDTNVNPADVDYPIVANDDSPTAVTYLLSELIETYGAQHVKSQNSKVKTTAQK